VSTVDVRRALLCCVATLGALCLGSGSGLEPALGYAPIGGAKSVRIGGPESVIRQRTGNDCGLVALTILLRDVGTVADLRQLHREVPIQGGGATMLALRQAAATHGVALRGVFADPLRSGALPTPWIAHLNSGGGHYVVVERSESARWIVADPSVGIVEYSENAFKRRWSGYALILDRIP